MLKNCTLENQYLDYSMNQQNLVAEVHPSSQLGPLCGPKLNLNWVLNSIFTHVTFSFYRLIFFFWKESECIIYNIHFMNDLSKYFHHASFARSFFCCIWTKLLIHYAICNDPRTAQHNTLLAYLVYGTLLGLMIFEEVKMI